MTRETWGVVPHPSKPVDASVRTIVDVAAAHDVDVVVAQSQLARTPGLRAVPDDEFSAGVDVVLSLGGDGTMLGAMRRTLPRPVPVLGINHGNLGFLVEIQPSDLERALRRLLDGDYTVEPHGCLEVSSTGRTPVPAAGFNDLVLVQEGRVGGLSVDLSVNDQRYGYYKCDALVVSTPTGSTAYNYAAGGPVLSPSATAVVVTPVAPMAGISRAVVFGPDDDVQLRLAEDSAAAMLTVDGTDAAELAPGVTLDAELRPDAAKVVRFAAGAHARRSQVKLSLLDLPLRPDQLVELVPEETRATFEYRYGASP